MYSCYKQRRRTCSTSGAGSSGGQILGGMMRETNRGMSFSSCREPIFKQESYRKEASLGKSPSGKAVDWGPGSSCHRKECSGVGGVLPPVLTRLFSGQNGGDMIALLLLLLLMWEGGEESRGTVLTLLFFFLL